MSTDSSQVGVALFPSCKHIFYHTFQQESNGAEIVSINIKKVYMDGKDGPSKLDRIVVVEVF